MIQIYEKSKHEWAAVAWFGHLLDSGDLPKLFLPPLHNLTDFLGLFASGHVLLMFDADTKGIWFATWVEPFASGAFFSLWVRPDYRKRSAALRNVNFVYDQAIKKFPVLIGVTRQPELHEMHLKVGYKFVGDVPKLLNGEKAMVYCMTRESRADAKVLKYGRIRSLVRQELRV